MSGTRTVRSTVRAGQGHQAFRQTGCFRESGANEHSSSDDGAGGAALGGRRGWLAYNKVSNRVCRQVYLVGRRGLDREW